MQPSSQVVVLESAEEDLSWIADMKVKTRVMAILRHRPTHYYDSHIQNIFVNQLFWIREMDRIVYSGGRLDDLIEASSYVLPNFICITDRGFNLVACSRAVKPQCRGHQHLVKHKCLDDNAIQYMRDVILPQSSQVRRYIASEPNDYREFPLIHFPLYVEGRYVLHVVVECARGTVEGVEEQFEIFMKRVIQICTKGQRASSESLDAWVRPLQRLVDGESVSDEYLATQLATTDLKGVHRFRLLSCKLGPDMPHQQKSVLLEETKHLNEGRCYPFIHGDCLLMLVFSTDLASNGLRAVPMDAIGREMLERFNVRTACSQVFHDIRHLHYAYKQIQVVYRFEHEMDTEYERLGNEGSRPMLPFEHALKYAIFSGSPDKDLLDYSFNSSIMKVLLDEDAAAGTDVARMLWVYLRLGCNAAEVAKHLHVHRNTVLYRMSRIEQRFGMDLSTPDARERLILDYQYLVLYRHC